MKPKQPEFDNALEYFLKDSEGPKFVRLNLKRDENFLSSLFLHFNEIDTSLSCLRDVEVYVSRFPNPRIGVPKNRYLSYHYDSHLAEVYLLNHRVERFLVWLQRKYRKMPNSEGAVAGLTSILKTFESATSELVGARGFHVHEKRLIIGTLRVWAYLSMCTSKTKA